MNPRISSTLTGLLLLATVAGCSNDKRTPSLDDADVTVPGVFDTSGGSTGAVAADDFCHVDISSNFFNTSYDSPGGFANISYGPWVPATAETVFGVAHDDTFFVMNCQGSDEFLVTVSVSTGQHLPMAPATYPIRKADNIFGGYDSNPPVLQVAPFLPGDFFWAISEDSTFTITEFDATHIAGTFQFYVSEAKSEAITDGLPAKTAVINGTFNLKNPN